MAQVAVIGAGMGAMAAAARLAVAGHTVEVYERADTYGGALRQYARDGFAFDTGPGLLHLPAVYRDLFVKTGREPLERCVTLRQVDPAARHVFADGTVLDLPDSSRGGVAAALDEAFGTGSGDRWNGVLDRARRVWETTRRPLLEEPLPAAPDPALHRDPYPALHRRGLLRRRRPTLAEAAADELREPRMAALLESYARAYGLDPVHAPAGAAVLAYLEQTFGTWYPAGGMRALARALHERCTARGVVFHFGREVAEVREEGGRARGLLLADGTEVAADTVVSGRPPARAEGTGAVAWCTVLLALRGPHPPGTPHRTVVHGGTRTVTVLRPDDPLLPPDDAHATAVLSTPVTGAVAGDTEGMAGVAEAMLAQAEEAGLGLAARTLWRTVLTPADHAAHTGAPDGLVPAPALAGAGGAYLRPANSAVVKGLYRVGGWAHPGGGLAHAGMSGALVAGLIVEGEGFRGSQ